MSNPIQNKQTVPVVSESASPDNIRTINERSISMNTKTMFHNENQFQTVSPGFQTIFIPMSERNMKEILSQAASMNMSIGDYIIDAGCYNPMVLQMEQIRDFTPVWAECDSIVRNLTDGLTKEMLYQAVTQLYIYIDSLLPDNYLNTSPTQINYDNMYHPSALTANEAQVTTSFHLEVPDHIFQYLNRCAGLMKIDLSNYLLYSAIRRVYLIPPASFEFIFLNLRNIGYLLNGVDDDPRDLLLEKLASIWHMFCNAMIALEVNQYQSNYTEYFPGEIRWELP